MHFYKLEKSGNGTKLGGSVNDVLSNVQCSILAPVNIFCCSRPKFDAFFLSCSYLS